MSMLAERRRKTKWVINPTKQPLWTQDSSGIKFGKELMEKMGWSLGRGLGSKEQGIQEPLQVSYKNDTKGMGFKGCDDDWIEYQDEFNMLLSQLSNNGNGSAVDNLDVQKLDVKSLELKSKHSRARVHYQKFTRGKDLSNYSENDLACIFGTNKTKKKKKVEVLIKTDKPDQCETSFGVTTINGGSIQDYFKKKLIFDKSESSGLLKTNETEENLSGRAVFTSDDKGNEKHGVEKRRCKKLKHKSKASNNVYETTDNCNTSSSGSEELNFLNDKNGKQKEKPKKRKAKIEAEPAEIERTGKNDGNRMTLSNETNKITETIFEVRESKKRKKSKTDGGESKICISEDIEKSNHFPNDEFFSTILREKRMKLKYEQKKHKEKHKLKSEVEEIVNESTENLAVNEGKKSKKKKHKFNLETESSEIKETHRFQVGDADKAASEDKQLIDIKGQKQKGEEKKRQCVIEDQFLDDNQLNTLHENKVQSFHSEETCYAIQEKCNSETKGYRKYIVVMEKKSKKKKHMSESEIEEINTDSFTINSDVFKQKKSKKRKRQSNSQNEFLQKKDEKPTEFDEISKCTTTLSNQHMSDKKKKKSCFEEDPHDSETENLEEIGSLYQELRVLKEREKRKKDKKIHPNPEIPEEDECFEADAERKKKKKQKTNSEHYTKQDVPLADHNGEEIQKFYSNDASLEKLADANERGVFEEMKPGKNWRENKIYEGRGNVDTSEEFIQEDCSGGKQVEVNISRKEVMNVNAEQKDEVHKGKEVPDASLQQRYTTDRVLDLIRWADIKEFRGSNLGNVLGYGFKKEYLRTKMR